MSVNKNHKLVVARVTVGSLNLNSVRATYKIVLNVPCPTDIYELEEIAKAELIRKQCFSVTDDIIMRLELPTGSKGYS